MLQNGFSRFTVTEPASLTIPIDVQEHKNIEAVITNKLLTKTSLNVTSTKATKNSWLK